MIVAVFEFFQDIKIANFKEKEQVYCYQQEGLEISNANVFSSCMME